MKPIKFTEDDGTILFFNPLHVTDVKVTHSEFNNDWCIVLNINQGNGHTIVYTKNYTSEKDCMLMSEYIDACMSIG